MELTSLFSSGLIGYLMIFLFNILNSTIFPFPEEIVIITVSYLAHIKAIGLIRGFVALFLGVLAGDNLAYWLGRSYGPQLLVKKMKEKAFFRSKIEKVERLLQAHGRKTVFVSRFLTGFRFYTPIVAGTVKMSYPKFFTFNFLGAIIFVPSLYTLSYIFTQNISFVLSSLGLLKEISNLILALVLAIISFLFIRSVYRHLRITPQVKIYK